MYLSKLEIHGFKSFAQRTAIQFDPGITAIVGPNGCGKSNIVDAVRWVIGEQRARILRSDKMDNVIFNGTSKRKALGMAEVLLTIENTRGVLPIEYTEVTLGRRLYRSGDSEYLLNGVKCRLQDITDLFMDTGMGAGAYSVIELKMIEEILSDNAQDRRRLFEEAAGITKYKLRRKQTLGKLDNTQADLTRLRDLTEEIEKRVRSLKRQAEKAARFKQHEQRLHSLEQALAQVEYDRLTAQKRTLKEESDKSNRAVEKLTAQLATEEAGIEELRVKLTGQEQTLLERQKHLNQHLESVRRLETELRLEQERLETARRNLERTLKEKEDAAEKRSALQESLVRLQSDLASAKPALEKALRIQEETRKARDTAQEIAVEHREQLQVLRQNEQTADTAHADVRRNLDRLSNRLEMLEQERSRTEQQIRQLEDTAGEIEAKAKHTARRLEETRAALASARTALDEAAHAREQKRNELAAATDALRQTERLRDAALAEAGLLESLVASYEEFPDAVQFLATTPQWKTSELQTVADLLACDERDRMALDAALGEYASCIVVRSFDDAARAVTLLQDEQKGRALFLVLDQIDERIRQRDTPVLNTAGARPLQSVVRVADPAYKPLVSLLLHDCYVVETFDEACREARKTSRPARFFTSSGEWVDAHGLLRAGSEMTGTSVVGNRLGRREQLATIRKTIEELESTLTAQSAEVQRIRTTLDEIPFETRRTEVESCKRAVFEAEKENERVEYERQNIKHHHKELDSHLRKLDDEIEAGTVRLAEMQQSVDLSEEKLHALRAERARAEETFQAAEMESRAALNRYNDASLAAVQARNQFDNLQRDIERTLHDIQDLDEQTEKQHSSIEQLQREIASGLETQSSLETQITSVRQQHEGLNEAVAASEYALKNTKAEIAEAEIRLRGLRQQREQFIREENNHAVRLAEVKTRITDLVASVQEDFGFSLDAGSIELEDGFDEMAARQEVQNLREKIRSIGAVNALALETYGEEKERLDFLSAQRQDLEKAESTLLSTIDEINTTAAHRFMETYEAIHANFNRIFGDLFGEGAASNLELTDPNDPLESPIEIMAKPRGKRPTTISQLSGGEKTLTAIALLFAIYLVKPSPFCILDEVDAPLDDANVERFMRLIRDFSRNTQFILVTHNKRTMEAADRMYGITMQEQGVSSLVGVKFDEVAVAE